MIYDKRNYLYKTDFLDNNIVSINLNLEAIDYRLHQSWQNQYLWPQKYCVYLNFFRNSFKMDISLFGFMISIQYTIFKFYQLLWFHLRQTVIEPLGVLSFYENFWKLVAFLSSSFLDDIIEVEFFFFFSQK